MNLKNIKLRNFKSIENLEINFDNDITNIFGQNASGKTTIFDAYLWVLFDKDSSDRKDFGVKTIKNGEVLHNLEHEVTAELSTDAEETILLKKIFKEKWTQKKGSETAEFSGHETLYWIDRLPMKKAEYEKKIEDIASESLFKMLSNPLYFNESMKWQDRRKLLFESFAKKSVDIFSMNTKLEEVRADIEKHGPENAKKIVTDRRKLLNTELTSIPTRIDEATRNIPKMDGVSETEKEKKEKEKRKKEIEEKRKGLNSQKNNADAAIAAYRQKSLEIEALKEKFLAEHMKKYIEAKEKGTSLYYEIQAKEKRIVETKEEIAEAEKEIGLSQFLATTLLACWREVKAETFQTPDIANFVCPTCKQNLPENDIEAELEKLKLNFETEKIRKLEVIEKEGKENKNKRESEEKRIAEAKEKIAETEKDIEQKKKEMAECKRIYEEGKGLEIDYTANKEYRKSKEELEKLETASFDDSEYIKLSSAIDVINSEIAELEKILALKTVVENSQKRIEELQNRQRELSSELLLIEKKEFLIDEYIKLRAKTVESSVNEYFNFVQWRIFETQINGGIVETCIATVQGIPYPDLNNAGKIQAGLDIIRAFSNKEDKYMPIFIDNAESITNIHDTGAQQIRLYVSEKYSELYIEKG